MNAKKLLKNVKKTKNHTKGLSKIPNKLNLQKKKKTAFTILR